MSVNRSPFPTTPSARFDYQASSVRWDVDDALAAGEALFTAVQVLRPPIAT